MCGICGTVAVSGQADTEGASLRVRAMLQALSHRGPDAVGHVVSESAVLGVTRLATRGLQDPNQPMVDPASGIVAVCNGEIDNHQELRGWLAERGRPVRDATDVAVIPGLYLELGEEYVTRLIGAFAIAVWDPRTRRLTLARDRAGERPLFYAVNGDEVIFATELAALVSRSRLPITFNQAALRKYIQLGIFLSPDTPFEEVHKVAPGEQIEIDVAGVRRKRYWRWQNTDAVKQPAAREAFDRVFRGAVERQSAVDVDFGVFLSGGVDSSLVSAVIRSLYPARPMKAYTLRFEEESFDEGAFAEDVGRQFKLDLVTVWVPPDAMRSELKTAGLAGGGTAGRSRVAPGSAPGAAGRSGR